MRLLFYLRRSILFIAFSLTLNAGFAQEEVILKDIEQQQIIQQYGLAWQDPFTKVNQAYISQIGDGNIAFITQNNILQSNANVAVVTQEGSFNQVNSYQQGQGSNIRLFQSGNYNEINSTIEGDFIHVITSQYGNENKILQEVSANGADYTVLQFGSNNSIEQRGDGFSTGYSIIQFGNNMNITVEQQSFLK